jgi:hypothetical protein
MLINGGILSWDWPARLEQLVVRCWMIGHLAYAGSRPARWRGPATISSRSWSRPGRPSQDSGISDVDHVLRPVDADEAHLAGVAAGWATPRPIARVVARAACGVRILSAWSDLRLRVVLFGRRLGVRGSGRGDRP